MDRDECVNEMSRAFFAEKAAREIGEPFPQTVNTAVAIESNCEPKVGHRAVKIEDTEIEMASQKSLPPESDSDESDSEHSEYNDALTDANWSLSRATDTDEWKKLKRLERETIETLQQIRQRLHSIEYRAARESRNVPAVREIDGILLKVEFEHINRLMIAEDGRNETDLSTSDYEMRNGLRFRFSQSTLEIRGNVRRVNGFQVSTIGMPFRIAISADSVDIDERFRLSKDGLLLRAQDTNALPAITRHGLTLCGPEQKIIRIQYLEFRYELKCTGNRLTMQPESGVITAPVTEEID